jgi:hypothetical protein
LKRFAKTYSVWNRNWAPAKIQLSQKRRRKRNTPYPHEHACRLIDPGKVEVVGSGERKHDSKTYRVIFAKPKGQPEAGSVEQAYRYPKDSWSVAEAKAHCEAHHGMMFEPASASENQLQYGIDVAVFDGNAAVEKDGILTKFTVFTKEGVQNKALKSREELKGTEKWLEYRPIVIEHPEGWPLQHQSPIGFTSDIKFREEDAAIVGLSNFWLDKTPQCILKGVRAGTIREGSVGYWARHEYNPGEFKGQPYTHVERNLLYEHYAILPGEKGACPCSEGCGLQNSREQPKGFTNLNQARKGEKEEKTMSEKPNDTPKTVEELEAELNALKIEQDKVVDERVSQFKADLEAKKNELAAKDKDIEKVKAERDTLLAKINAMVQAERQRLEAAKNHLIAEVVAQTGEAPDTYTGWDVAQLQKLNEVLKSNQVDRFAKTPRSASVNVDLPQPTLGSPLDPRTAKQWKEL